MVVDEHGVVTIFGLSLENGKEDINKIDKSYFAIDRYKRRKNILKIGLPIAAVVVVLGIVFGLQASGQGSIGTKMVMHIHPQL